MTTSASPFESLNLEPVPPSHGGVGAGPRTDLNLLRRAITSQWIKVDAETWEKVVRKIWKLAHYGDDARVRVKALELMLKIPTINNGSAAKIIDSLLAEEKINEGHEDDETPTRPTVVRVKTIEDGHRVLDAMREGPVEVEVDDEPGTVAEVAAALDAIAETAGPEPVAEQQPAPVPPAVEAGHEGNGNGKPKRRFTY